jgi:hypothetical protein
VTLSWSAVEGGTYKVEATTNFSTWTLLSTNISARQTVGQTTDGLSNALKFYRVARTGLANFDPVSGATSGGGGIITMNPSSGSRGTTFGITAIISSTTTPPPPPQSGAPITAYTIGTISVTGASYVYSNGQGIITGTITIPTGYSPTNGQTVVITFAPPPGQQNGPAYTQANGFTVD